MSLIATPIVLIALPGADLINFFLVLGLVIIPAAAPITIPTPTPLTKEPIIIDVTSFWFDSKQKCAELLFPKSQRYHFHIMTIKLH
jgi:hypothetical protein